MSNKKKLETPLPDYFEDPRFTSGLDQLFGFGEDLTSFNFGGDLSPLQDVISFNPEITERALSTIDAQMAPGIRDQRQQLINTLASNNQLESSVTGDVLGRFGSDIQSQRQAFAGQAGMADINRALQGRQDLFGLGLNTLTTGTQFGQNAGVQRNTFNQTQFENQLGLNIFNQDSKGGWAGAGTGAVGGAMAGSSLGPWGAVAGALVGGASGYFSESGAGGQILQGGAGIYGSSLGNVDNPYSGSGTSNLAGNTYVTQDVGGNFGQLGGLYGSGGGLGGSLYGSPFAPGKTASNKPFGDQQTPLSWEELRLQLD